MKEYFSLRRETIRHSWEIKPQEVFSILSGPSWSRPNSTALICPNDCPEDETRFVAAVGLARLSSKVSDEVFDEILYSGQTLQWVMES